MQIFYNLSPAFGAAATPAFGASAAPVFGATSSAAPAFGTAPAAAPTFGFGTSTSISTAAPSFGFGTQTTASTAAPTFGGFGTGAAPAFGQQTSTASGGFGGLGAPATSGFGGTFGATGGFGGFGTTNTTTSAPLFSGFGVSNTQTTGGVFGSNFGKPVAQTSAFGGAFGAPQQQQPAAPTADEAFINSISNVSIYGDERDTVLAKWNYLQTQWGAGKSFYNGNAAPYEIQPDNVLCRFKAMGYNKLPGRDNKIGFVSMTLGKSADTIRGQQQQLVDQLKQVFGQRPNLMVHIEAVKPVAEARCQAVIYVEERQQNSNETKRISATDVVNYLNQPLPKSQIASMGVEQLIPLVAPDEDQLKEYLDNAPKGIDPRLWRQAIQDNPDPEKLIPVPITGFNELKWRIKCQENETDTHTLYLQKAQKDIADLKQRHASTLAKIMEQRRKFADLSHRILQVS